MFLSVIGPIVAPAAIIVLFFLHLLALLFDLPHKLRTSDPVDALFFRLVVDLRVQVVAALWLLSTSTSMRFLFAQAWRRMPVTCQLTSTPGALGRTLKRLPLIFSATIASLSKQNGHRLRWP
jgi:hypothetical protein